MDNFHFYESSLHLGDSSPALISDLEARLRFVALIFTKSKCEREGDIFQGKEDEWRILKEGHIRMSVKLFGFKESGSTYLLSCPVVSLRSFV